MMTREPIVYYGYGGVLFGDLWRSHREPRPARIIYLLISSDDTSRLTKDSA
jgi:hypothetical protein